MAVWHQSFLVAGHAAAVLSAMAVRHLVHAAPFPGNFSCALRLDRAGDAVVLSELRDLGGVAEPDDLGVPGLLWHWRFARPGGAPRHVAGKSRTALAVGIRAGRIPGVFHRTRHGFSDVRRAVAS